VRFTPATTNVETCRPGVILAPLVFAVVVVPAGADVTVDVDVGVTVGVDMTVGATEAVEVAPDEQAAANPASVVIVAIEPRRALRIMTQGWRDRVASR